MKENNKNIPTVRGTGSSLAINIQLFRIDETQVADSLNCLMNVLSRFEILLVFFPCPKLKKSGPDRGE